MNNPDFWRSGKLVQRAGFTNGAAGWTELSAALGNKVDWHLDGKN